MAASTACSDHCPLLLADVAAPNRKATFRFESFWPRFPHFRETVERAWLRPVDYTCPMARLKIKMQRTSHDLKIWSKSLFSDAKIQFHLAAEIILRLDIAQEKHQLTTAEFNLRKQLKQRIVGLAAIERARKRQAARITWLRARDARTAFFQAKINARRRKNFIHSLQIDSHTAISHTDKAAAAAHDHFVNLLGTKRDRGCAINWDGIDLPSVSNAGLDNPFTEQEVWAAVIASPADKAPGPDGFSGNFFRTCWSTIKLDIMAMFDHFYSPGGGATSPP
ncbi:uncharacterized protein [Aegilops tauschii subsp. strangulata]|uniref:uncharacterized protein n=1 Tax=Aegilops tauschii subsp. strangulata TaxID=200361 RepID=UPI003CC88560